MLLSLLLSLLLFFGLTLGLAWPAVSRLALSPLEKAIIVPALSLIGVFLVSWFVYVTALPVGWLWILPGFAIAAVIIERRSWIALWHEEEVRHLWTAQLIVTLWSVGWMASIVSYSGGGWAGDWYEHWERSRFFLEHWPLDRNFLGAYPVTARPPLINVVTGTFLYLTQVDFAHYQLFTTLLSSLVFLPAASLAHRFGSSRAVAVLAVMFMVNPLFVQNATFAWTKLPTAFFILCAVAFFLRTHDLDTPKSAAPLFGVLIAAGVLSHYSTGPYVVGLAGGWLFLGWQIRRNPEWWQRSAQGVAMAAVFLAAWFGWSMWTYGMRATFFSNSSVTGLDPHLSEQLGRIGLNIRDTFIPHFLRNPDQTLIAQRSVWGSWRDFFFQAYQLNFLLAFGSLAWLALAREVYRAGRVANARVRVFWSGFVVGVIILGIASVGQRDHWGLAHICLPPLTLLGLAFLAARWSSLGRGWQRLIIAGGTVDFVLGIVLHFGAQSFVLDRWLTPLRTSEDVLTSYNSSALLNIGGKLRHKLSFVADAVPVPFELLLTALAVLLFIAVRRIGPARKTEPRSRDAGWADDWT